MVNELFLLKLSFYLDIIEIVVKNICQLQSNNLIGHVIKS